MNKMRDSGGWNFPRTYHAFLVKANIAREMVIGMAGKSYPKPPSGKKLIFRPWKIDPKTGDKMWARAYGFKAWPILVPE